MEIRIWERAESIILRRTAAKMLCRISWERPAERSRDPCPASQRVYERPCPGNDPLTQPASEARSRGRPVFAIRRQGFASLHIRPPNTKYSDQLSAAYREAREEKRGLQGDE